MNVNSEGLRRICSGLQESVPEILEGWRRIAEEQLWAHLPMDYNLDHLPSVISQISQAALHLPSDEEFVREKVWASARHGEDRQVDGFSESLLFREYHLLREALWRHIQQRHGTEDPVAMDAITRIDASITLATAAALRGYHRPAFEARGEWPDALERLLQEWGIQPHGRSDVSGDVDAPE